MKSNPRIVGERLIGTVCGAHLVTGVSDETHIHVHGSTGKRTEARKLATCCVHCGAKCAIPYQSLLSARRRGYTHCDSCSPNAGNGGRASREKSANGCRKCEGQPWRRPIVGVCRCGERYSPEILMIASGQFQSSIALCEGA